MAKVIKKWEFSPKNTRASGYPWGRWCELDEEGVGRIFVVEKDHDFTTSIRSFTTQLTQQAAKRKIAVQYDALLNQEPVQASNLKANAVVFRFYDPSTFDPEEE